MKAQIKINLEMPIAKEGADHTEAAISADVSVTGSKDYCVVMMVSIMQRHPHLAGLIVISALKYLTGKKIEVGPVNDDELQQVIDSLIKKS